MTPSALIPSQEGHGDSQGKYLQAKRLYSKYSFSLPFDGRTCTFTHCFMPSEYLESIHWQPPEGETRAAIAPLVLFPTKSLAEAAMEGSDAITYLFFGEDSSNEQRIILRHRETRPSLLPE